MSDDTRKAKKASIRRRLEECIAGQGRYAISIEGAKELLREFDEVCEDYNAEIENLGYECMGDDL